MRAEIKARNLRQGLCYSPGFLSSPTASFSSPLVSRAGEFFLFFLRADCPEHATNIPYFPTIEETTL